MTFFLCCKMPLLCPEEPDISRSTMCEAFFKIFTRVLDGKGLSTHTASQRTERS